MVKEIKFGSDTKERKEWFIGLSFSHPQPAKMHLSLQQEAEDSFATIEQVMEKLCSKYVNTMPKIEFEDVLVFRKEMQQKAENE